MSWDSSFDLTPALRKAFLVATSTTIALVDDELLLLYKRPGWKAVPLPASTVWMTIAQEHIASLEALGVTDAWAFSIETLDGWRRVVHAALSYANMLPLVRRFAPFDYALFLATSSDPSAFAGAMLSLTTSADYDIVVAHENLFRALKLEPDADAFDHFTGYVDTLEVPWRARLLAVSDALERYNGAELNTVTLVAL